MSEMVIFIGLQGSGKTTFYRSRFADTHVLVSKDRLRHNCHRDRRQRELIREALGQGRCVVVDNTNATRADREPLIAIGREHGARITGYFFESIPASCRKRNRCRTDKDRVPDVALWTTLQRLQPPAADEGFDQRHYVRCLENGQFEVLAWHESPVPSTPS